MISQYKQKNWRIRLEVVWQYFPAEKRVYDFNLDSNGVGWLSGFFLKVESQCASKWCLFKQVLHLYWDTSGLCSVPIPFIYST